mgnify:CR=1 FL=1
MVSQRHKVDLAILLRQLVFSACKYWLCMPILLGLSAALYSILFKGDEIADFLGMVSASFFVAVISLLGGIVLSFFFSVFIGLPLLCGLIYRNLFSIWSFVGAGVLTAGLPFSVYIMREGVRQPQSFLLLSGGAIGAIVYYTYYRPSKLEATLQQIKKAP